MNVIANLELETTAGSLRPGEILTRRVTLPLESSQSLKVEGFLAWPDAVVLLDTEILRQSSQATFAVRLLADRPGRHVLGPLKVSVIDAAGTEQRQLELGAVTVVPHESGVAEFPGWKLPKPEQDEFSWFAPGAAVLLLGLVLGLWHWQRRRSRAPVADRPVHWWQIPEPDDHSPQALRSHAAQLVAALKTGFDPEADRLSNEEFVARMPVRLKPPIQEVLQQLEPMTFGPGPVEWDAIRRLKRRFQDRGEPH